MTLTVDHGLSRLRVALYGRVSTLDKGQDVDLQLNELREYSERRGWKISGEYVDNGVSRAMESRPSKDSRIMRLRQSLRRMNRE